MQRRSRAPRTSLRLEDLERLRHTLTPRAYYAAHNRLPASEVERAAKWQIARRNQAAGMAPGTKPRVQVSLYYGKPWLTLHIGGTAVGAHTWRRLVFLAAFAPWKRVEACKPGAWCR